MAKRINHNMTSAATTTGWETAKGAIAVPIILTLAAAATGGLAVGGLLSLTALTAGLAVPVGIGAALVTGVATFTGAGPIAALVGGGLGLLKGGSKVGAEKSAFQTRQQIMATSRNNEHDMVAQQAYAVGMQHGQQSVVQELQQMQEKMIAGHMDKQAMQNPVGEHTAKIAQERAGKSACGGKAGCGQHIG